MLYNSFNHLAESKGDGTVADLSVFNRETTTNDGFDVTSNPNGTTTVGAPQQQIPAVQAAQPAVDRNAMPEWGNSLTKRVGNLETDMQQVKQDVKDIKTLLQQR